jgi:hypothetical protein
MASPGCELCRLPHQWERDIGTFVRFKGTLVTIRTTGFPVTLCWPQQTSFAQPNGVSPRLQCASGPRATDSSFSSLRALLPRELRQQASLAGQLFSLPPAHWPPPKPPAPFAIELSRDRCLQEFLKLPWIPPEWMQAIMSSRWPSVDADQPHHLS